jgi:hypothetical protein
MISNVTRSAIDLEQVDELVVVGNDIYEELEQVASAIAPDPSFAYIHSAHREFAEDTASVFNRVRLEQVLYELAQGQRVLDAKERLTRRREFSQWKQALSATAADIRRWVKLVLTFGDFPLEKVVAIARAVNIYALCVPRFASLVERLRELPVLAADVIKQMLKEARPPRKPKQRQEVPTQPEVPSGWNAAPSHEVEWQQDASGGGRHLSLNLYDDALNTEIKQVAEEKQITAAQAIADAFRKSKLVEEAQRSRSEAITEIREKQIELQKENIRLADMIQQQERCIQELKAQVVDIPKPPSSTASVKEVKPAIYIEHFDTWEELAKAVNSESDRFVAVIKLASTQERSQFVQLLSAFCERELNALDQLDWVPPRFLDSALRYLSFSIQQFADTGLAEDPVIETVLGCKFVSVKDFGVSGERWVFQLPNGKNIPVFERSQFAIEKF